MASHWLGRYKLAPGHSEQPIEISSDDETGLDLTMGTSGRKGPNDTDPDIIMLRPLLGPSNRPLSSPSKSSSRRQSKSSSPTKASRASGTADDAITIEDSSDSCPENAAMGPRRTQIRPKVLQRSGSSTIDTKPVVDLNTKSTSMFGAASSATAGPGPTTTGLKSPVKSTNGMKTVGGLPSMNLDYDSLLHRVFEHDPTLVLDPGQSSTAGLPKRSASIERSSARGQRKQRKTDAPDGNDKGVEAHFDDFMASSGLLDNNDVSQSEKRSIRKETSNLSLAQTAQAADSTPTGIEGQTPTAIGLFADMTHTKNRMPQASIPFAEATVPGLAFETINSIPDFTRPVDEATKAGMSLSDWLKASKSAPTRLGTSYRPAIPTSAKFDLVVPSLSSAERGLYTSVALSLIPRRSAVNSHGTELQPRPIAGPSRLVPGGETEMAPPPLSPAYPSYSPQRKFRLPKKKEFEPTKWLEIPTMSEADWRRLLLSDGKAEVDILVDIDDHAKVHESSDDIYDIDDDLTLEILPPPDQLAPSRQGKAVREVFSPFLDKWNSIQKKGISHNGAIHRLMFESYMTQSTSCDEPEADQIKVYNEVEWNGPPPDFEFVYSNQIVYGEGVPDPELGLGCGCDGPCDPSSDCTCVKRQELYFMKLGWEGFAYHGDGKLKDHQFPIWECGSTCRCPPECSNRVIQRGRSKDTKVDLFKTPLKGWGVRARVSIPQGTFVGIYAGELVTEDEGERRGVTYEKVGRTYLFDCDGWHIRNPPHGLRELDPRLADLTDWTYQRFLQNAAETDKYDNYSAYSIDAFHYGFTRFFNHSCDPNLVICQAYVHDFHPERPLTVIFTRRDVARGEELCISYKGVTDDQEDESQTSTPKKKAGNKIKSSPAHVTQRHKEIAAESKQPLQKDKCYCLSAKCNGYMFSFGDAE